jgi:hypothetical protein
VHAAEDTSEVKKYEGHSRPSMQRRAFATILSMFVLTLVVSALLAGAALCAADQHRTHAAQIGAQLRQLLLAGAQSVSASHWSHADQPRSWEVRLPPELKSNGASVSVDINPLADGAISATIRATFSTQRAEQELVFRPPPDEELMSGNRDGDWELQRIDERIPY